MGQYDQWVGDIEDYTDEEVVDFSITGVARERIIRLRLAWRWCAVRRDTDASLPGEAAVLAVLAGGPRRPGMLRKLAEELYTLVTVPEDGEGVPALGPWRVEDIGRLGKLLEAHPLVNLCTLYSTEVEGLLRQCATMTKAIPRYNHTVKGGHFPEALWDRGTKKLFNQVMYRLDKEFVLWTQCRDNLMEGP